MKERLLILFSIIFVNLCYASFPIENELNEVSNHTGKIGPGGYNDAFLFILGIGFLAGIALIIYWGVKKLLSREMERKKKISVIVGLLLGVLVLILLNQVELGYA